jgi:hypothetical protein
MAGQAPAEDRLFVSVAPPLLPRGEMRGVGGRVNFALCACLSGPRVLTYNNCTLRAATPRSRCLSSKFPPAPVITAEKSVVGQSEIE